MKDERNAGRPKTTGAGGGNLADPAARLYNKLESGSLGGARPERDAGNARMPGIIEQLKGLEKTLAYEGDLIDQVHARLSPILRPEDCNGEAGSNAIVLQPSPLSEDLRMLQTRAGMNIARLTELLTLIDL